MDSAAPQDDRPSPTTKLQRFKATIDSVRARSTWGGDGIMNGVNSATPQNHGVTKLQRVRARFATLLVPEYKVGQPPGFMRELKTILFGTCASQCSICFGVT
jgi:hypothetical protein